MSRPQPSQPSQTDSELAKAYGAFYTDAQVAEFLVWWAIRSANDTVMDPSFGGGVFLSAASARLTQFGGNPANQVFGIELDPQAHGSTSRQLGEEFGVQQKNLLSGDFFSFDASPERQVDSVVGNPPFVRYQRFSGEARSRALTRAASYGVRLSALSSSWAPFLVHSIGMVKEGGRLAMVAPMEIGHAGYARPVLDYLKRSFGRVTFLTFRRKLFPELSEDTLLLLGEGKGLSRSSFYKRDFSHVGELAGIQRRDRLPLTGTRRLNTQAVSEGSERLIEYLIPKKSRELYRNLKALGVIRRLGELADVGIGYVTGANEFFHLSVEQAERWGIPDSYLRAAVRRGRALTGLRFTEKDWQHASRVGEAGFLLCIQPKDGVHDAVRRYLRSGEQKGVPLSFKCRSRSPWYCVPHVHEPDGFLSYMSGSMPLVATNDACAVAPNSLHILRLHPHHSVSCDALASSWLTSLTRLSVEIEGHSLGGGMLKLEPSEAERVLLPVPPASTRAAATLTTELDRLVRCGDHDQARSRADNVILKEMVGLTSRDCRLLREAAEILRTRRYSRSSAA